MTLGSNAGAARLAVFVCALITTGCPTDDVASPGDGTDTEASSTGADSSSGGGGSISMTSMTNATGSGDSGDDSSGGTTSAATGTGDTGDASSDGGGPATCGNNILETGEECDLTQLDGQDCLSMGFDSGVLACDLTCQFNTAGCGVCGNDVVDEAENCDGLDLLKEDCVTQGFVGGVLGCLPDCSALDTSGCSEMAVCGNDLTEIPETCDGTDLGGEDCVSLGFANGGTLSCNGACTGFDLSQCLGMGGDCCIANGSPGCENALCEMAICAADPFCCNNTWDGICANAALSNPACVGVSASCPSGMEVCGNDVLEALELCDGTDLGGQTCATQGWAGGGNLGCDASCQGSDVSGCDGGVGDCCAANGTGGCDVDACEDAVCALDVTCCTQSWDAACVQIAGSNPACFGVGGSCPDGTEVCGDDVAEVPETCDGTDLFGQTCISLGFPGGGTLSCLGDCSAFDTSGCNFGGGDCCSSNGSPGCDDPTCEAIICALDPFCCNNTWDGICANEALAEPACQGAGGTCPPAPAMCGNGLAEGAEACDGTDLGGADCVSEGFSGGTLSCLGDCSGLDTSLCTNNVGDCCANNGSPGCQDPTCEAAVCAASPNCCNNTWNMPCANAALAEPACVGAGGTCP